MSSGINVIASTFDASEENTTLFRQIMEKKWSFWSFPTCCWVFPYYNHTYFPNPILNYHFTFSTPPQHQLCSLLPSNMATVLPPTASTASRTFLVAELR